MENNNPVSQPAPTVQPVAAQMPIPPVSQGSSKKIILWFTIGLVIVVAVVGAIYFFLQSKQEGTTNETSAVTTPVPSSKEDLESDLNNIDVKTATDNSDFTPVDQDLQNL